MQRKRSGFTLIEILVVVGIIAALVAMLFLGFKYVGRSSRDNLTHTTLQNLRGMLTEYTTSGGSIDKLEDAYRIAGPGVPAVLTISVPQDSSGTTSVAENMPARSGAVIEMTRQVMNRILAVPSNKKVLENLPPDHIWRTANGVVLLDGHHNPIVFVPRRGMRGVNLGFTNKGAIPYSNPDQTIASPGAKLIAPGPPPIMEGQPFFASSGEDADFSKGDDNHYSFEQ